MPLAPLTDTEIDRLRDLYARGPLTTTDAHRSTDASLVAKGWIQPYDDDDGEAVEVASDGYFDGRCVLYGDDGLVRDCWRA